ncbi:MAG: hypothetical protein FWD57_00545 [Polyangiaceae bacterium]|nr:hypothetical protein [Polyangiaceae bacterium]
MNPTSRLAALICLCWCISCANGADDSAQGYGGDWGRGSDGTDGLDGDNDEVPSDGGGGSGGGAVGGSGGGVGGGGTGGGGGSGGDEQCVPVKDPCDVFPPCGCLVGEACDISNSTSGATACYVSAGVPLGSPCSKRGDCVSGALCMNDACRSFCVQNSDCPVSGAHCIQATSITHKDIPGKKHCSDHCEPWDPASCGGGLGCRPAGNIGENPGTTECRKANSSTGPCGEETGYLCAPGYICLTSGLCKKMCRVGMSTVDCPGSTNCGELSVGLFFGEQAIGVCN